MSLYEQECMRTSDMCCGTSFRYCKFLTTGTDVCWAFADLEEPCDGVNEDAMQVLQLLEWREFVESSPEFMLLAEHVPV